LIEVEHCVPKSEFPKFAVDWDNFLLSCGPCNKSKSNHPTWGELGVWRKSDPLDEQTSFQEIRQTYVLWPDTSPDTYREQPPVLQYQYDENDNDAWQTLTDSDAVDLGNQIVSTDVSLGLVRANLPLVGQSNVPVRIHIEPSKEEAKRLREHCKLNQSSAKNPSYDRRVFNRTSAWFKILDHLRALDPANITPGAFPPAWHILLLHAESLGFYSLWVRLLLPHYDPLADPTLVNLGRRFVHDIQAAKLFPGTEDSNIP
jgi:hypothetical protein